MQTDLDEVKTWAIVRAIQPDGQLLLNVSDQSASACHSGGCGAGGLGCQTNAFAHLLKRAPALKLRLPTTEALSEGDRLLLSLSQRALIRLSLMAYGLPLVALLLGMGLGQVLADDLGALLFGVGSLLSSWYMVGKLTLSCTPSVHEIYRLTH